MQPQSIGFRGEENGTINWVVGENASRALADHFTFLQGDTASMNATVAEKEEGYVVKVQNPDLFFVTDGSAYSSMQMQIAVALGDYEGDIILAHHVHDVQNYAYLALHPNGAAELDTLKTVKSQLWKRDRLTGREWKLLNYQ